MKNILKNVSLGSVFILQCTVMAHTIPADCTYMECTVSPIVRPSKTKTQEQCHISYPYQPATRATGSSNNWAGYVAVTNLNNPANNSVSKVSGTWIVPAVKKSNDHTYCAIWVGIDGYSSGTVEQLGTEHEWVNGQQKHYAWFEMYPDYAYQINGFPVNVGDSISASVEYIGNNTFKLSMTNNTKKVTTVVPYSHTQSTVAKRSCAEWVAEAPWMNGVLPLSNFGSIKFSDCTATINGIDGTINNNHWNFINVTMIANDQTPKATTSNLTNNGKNFNVDFKKSKRRKSNADLVRTVPTKDRIRQAAVRYAQH